MQVCSDSSTYSIQSMECVSYVMGVWDGFVLGKRANRFVSAMKRSILQLEKIVVTAYVSERPELAQHCRSRLSG